MLHEIENLSFAELKSRQADLISEAAKAAPGELAARYVKARTDAKHRDEKLAEQAVTIKALQDGMDAVTGKATGLENNLRQALATIENQKSEATKLAQDFGATQVKLTSEIDRLKQELAAEKQARTTAEALAKARRGALASVINIVSPLLAEEG